MATHYAPDFSLSNIPFGVASSKQHSQKAIVTRLGDDIIFIDMLVEDKLLPTLSEETRHALKQQNLNEFAALGRSAQHETRLALQSLLDPKYGCSNISSKARISASDAQMHLPIAVADFTDFSCSKDHVLNAGEAIQGVRKLPPGFLHFPVGYSGRSSSIVVSGTPITRPLGQYRDECGCVVFKATRQLDFELEVACIIGKPSKFGVPVRIEDAEEHIFGLVLLNDWSARDIQALEMQPLGPMNGKSFGTTMSPWVISLDALNPHIAASPARDIPVAAYLEDKRLDRGTYDIHLKVDILSNENVTTVCESNAKSLYWNFRHMVAQQTINGCSLSTGDILATGTISGSRNGSQGCLLEISAGGKRDLTLSDGSWRTFLEDGDGVRLSGWSGNNNMASRIGFGDCFGFILPSKAHK